MKKLPPIREVEDACERARDFVRLCDLLQRGHQGELFPESTAQAAAAAEAGMSYAELEQYNPESDFYDPDIGPYAWED